MNNAVSFSAPPTQIWVIVLSWNNYALTAACLRSLQQVNHPGKHVLLVDNASEDDTPARARAEFGADIDILVNPKNLGFAQGNNAGMQYAFDRGADYVLLLNNDTTVDPGFIAPLEERFRRSPRTGAVTSKIYYQTGANQSPGTHQDTLWAAGGQIRWWLGQARCRGQGQLDRGQFDRAERVDYAQGCSMLISRTALAAAGGLDNSFFAYFEDSDWSLRCRAAGFDIWYEPSSVVWHRAGQSYAADRSRQAGKRVIFQPPAYVLHMRNGLWFFRRHGRGVQRVICLASFTAQAMAFSAKLLFLGHAQAARAVWHGLANGWSNLPAMPQDNPVRSEPA